MRITDNQRRRVKEAVARRFGEDAALRLFGSRVDDARRGGDYDFYLETVLDDAAEITRRKLELLAELHASPEFEGEKIDLVIVSPLHSEERSIDRVAKREGIVL